MKDLNELARVITLKEGKKINLTIAQVKEVLSVFGDMLRGMTDEEIADLIKKLKNPKK